jgi:hypothetical protein
VRTGSLRKSSVTHQVAKPETRNLEVIETNSCQPKAVEVREESPIDITMADPNDVRNLFENMLAAIKDSNRQIQESNDKLRKSVEESNKALQINVAASNIKLLESVKADIKSETEQLIKRFDLENQRLGQEFSEKLHSEIRKSTHLIGQVQKDTETELLAVKKDIQGIKAGIEGRLDKEIGQVKDTLNENNEG